MKNKILVVSLISLLYFTFGCQNKEAMAELEEFKAQKAFEEANKALVIRYFGAVERGDLEAVKEIFSTDCILHHTSGQDWSLEKTIETVKKQNEQSKVMFPDLTFINEGTIINGDKAVLMYTFKGTHKGDVEGIPLMLVGNKNDETAAREVATEMGAGLAKQWGCAFMETSAKTNCNVKELFQELLQMEKRRNMTLALDPKKSKSQKRKEKLKGKCVMM